LQKRNKRPLVLKDHLDKSSEMRANILVITKKHKGKGKGNGQYVESDKFDDEEMEESENDNGLNQLGTRSGRTGQPTTATDNEGHGTVLPQSPKSVAISQETHHKFLNSLSQDAQYQKLILLLCAAKVSYYMLVYLVTDSFSRMATYWRDRRRYGHPGNHWKATCPMRFMNRNHLHRSRPSHGGLLWTQSPWKSICLHHISKWSSLS
jgi:hypothetical protein